LALRYEKTNIGASPFGRRLREIAAAHDSVVALYGMGSFFRGEPHNDVDFVVVLACDPAALLGEARSIRRDLCTIGDSVGERVDVTVFTRSEFELKPLRDMDALVSIFQRS